MNYDKIAAAVAAFPKAPDNSGVPIPVAGAILQRSDVSIHRDIKAGRLKSFLIGRSRRIMAGSIRAVMAGG